VANSPTYRVELAPSAVKQLADLDRKARARVAAKIDALSLDPRPQGVEKLEGADNQYRVRVGHYRIIDSIEDKRLVVLVLRIGHRRDVYRRR
jgi:mRNA interferase RelE/StbE